jgi:cell wall-associated NlpC family hydrolase
MANWTSVPEPEPGNGILFRSTNPPWHIGVAAGDGWMIHASESAGAVVRERYNAFPWHKRIEGFYRWRQVSSRR